MSGELSGSKAGAAKLRKLVSKKRYDELELAWTEAVENDSIEPGDLFSVLDRLVQGGHLELAESLLWFLLTAHAERTGPEDGLRVARSAVGTLPESQVLREELASLYQATCAGVPHIETLTEMTISCHEVPFAAAVARIEKYVALQPDTYVFDADRQEPGRVVGFDAGTQALEVSFADGPSSYEASSVAKLEALDADDFRALSVFEPEKLKQLAQDDPGELVTRALRAFGPRLTFQRLKSRLAGIIPAGSWSQWWTMAKPQLRRAPWVDMSDKAQPAFALRSQPIAHEDILRAQFNSAGSSGEKLVNVLEHLNEVDRGAEASADLLAFFGKRLDQSVDEWRGKEPAAALGAAALGSEIAKRASGAASASHREVGPLLPPDAELADLMRPIVNEELARLILAFIRNELPSRWPEVFVAVMPGCPPAGCDLIAEELSASGRVEGLRAAVAAVLARPGRNASGLAWLWRTTCAGGLPGALGEVDRVAVALGLFSAASILGRGASRSRADRRHLLPQVRSAISFRDYEPLRDVLKDADEDRARRIRNFIERHTGLSDNACHRVHEILRRTHPDLFAEHVDPWLEDVIYTTEAGLKKRQAELSRLVKVKLAEASKAVGAAAALGDLSENAEWAAAKEECNYIATRATRMQEEIKKARVITPGAAGAETVTVGSSVRARDLSTDVVETMTFLGPWDADHDNNIYSYRAKLGLAFMGKKPGDRVSLSTDGGEYAWEIIEIRPGI